MLFAIVGGQTTIKSTNDCMLSTKFLST